MVISHYECSKENDCSNCIFPQHPQGCDGENCLVCSNHCPCCMGHLIGVCNQCPEEDCGNRNAPYDAVSVSKKEE